VKIYTRTGDNGTTALRGGKRVRKDAPRIEACGTVDELNSAIGLARSLHTDRKLDAILTGIQRELFDVGATLAGKPEQSRNMTPRIPAMEKLIDQLETELPPLKEFILPVGPLHLARAVCRRAERACVTLAADEKGIEPVVGYLNRLGDLLFVLARWASGGTDAKVSPRQGSRRTAPRAR